MIDSHLTILTCTLERGHFKTVFHREKKKPNSEKKLNFDTLRCENCAGFVMVLWSANQFGRGLHEFRVLPYPLRLVTYPKHWPEEVGGYWLQAKRNIIDENWDAAALMARSTLQAAFRDKKAEGKNLQQEIGDFAEKGELPAIMKEWADPDRCSRCAGHSTISRFFPRVFLYASSPYPRVSAA